MIVCEKCNKSFKNGRAIHAHKKFHCRTEQQEQESDICLDECRKAFLSVTDIHHAEAIKAGYVMFCIDCKELY
jgi:hypothetical protein